MPTEEQISNFITACRLGTVEKVSNLLNSSDNLQELLRDCMYYGFRVACQHGNLDILKLLLVKTENTQEMLASRNFEGFGFACAGGHLHVAKWLIENFNDKKLQMMFGSFNNPFIWSCMHGHLDVVKYLYEIANDKERLLFEGLNANISDGFVNAVKFGQVSIIKWFFEIVNEVQKQQLIGSEFFVRENNRRQKFCYIFSVCGNSDYGVSEYDHSIVLDMLLNNINIQQLNQLEQIVLNDTIL